MSSTNKTTHYDLSQYIGSDKPTYLTDYNGDMNKIDTAIYDADALARVNESAIGNLTDLTTTAKNNLVSAINELDGEVTTNTANISTNTSNISTNATNISTNATNIGNLNNLTTASKTNLVSAINEVDANSDSNTSAIGTLTNLSTNEKSNLVGAINEVNYNVNNFNLSSFETITSFTLYNRDGNVDTSATATGEITVAKNSDGSLAKLYGRISINGINSTRRVKFQTSLRPAETLNINGGGVRINISDINGNECIRTMNLTTLTINTNGLCEMEYGYNWSSSERVDFLMINSLMFIKDFGDSPIPV